MCTRPTQRDVRPNHALHLTSRSSTYPVTVCRTSLCDLVVKTRARHSLRPGQIPTTRVFTPTTLRAFSCNKRRTFRKDPEISSRFNHIPKPTSKHVFSQSVYDPPGQGLWRRRLRGQACQEPYRQDVSQRSHSKQDLGTSRADSHYEHALLQRPGHSKRAEDCHINFIFFTPLRREFRPLPDRGVFTSHKPRFAFPE